MLLSGCANDAVRVRSSTNIPPAPAYLTPVTVSAPKKGEFAETVINRERAGRNLANSKIIRARGDWDAMRKTFAGDGKR